MGINNSAYQNGFIETPKPDHQIMVENFIKKGYEMGMSAADIKTILDNSRDPAAAIAAISLTHSTVTYVSKMFGKGESAKAFQAGTSFTFNQAIATAAITSAMIHGRDGEYHKVPSDLLSALAGAIGVVEAGLYADKGNPYTDKLVSQLAGLRAFVSLAALAASRGEEIWDSIDDAFRSIPTEWENLKDGVKTLGDTARQWFDDLDPFKDTDNIFENLLPGWAREWFGLNRDGFANFRIGYSDPLSLDLDGDGIETVGHNGTGGAMFDFDADGIKNPTGWLKPDDGLLVFDRNGDGIINNGTELFGDSTLLENGEKAEHGFAALADLDTNKDGVIDAKDTAFSKLKVWRDLNGDGISQANELFTLKDLGIASLNLEYKNVNVGLAGNNQLAQIGSYTKTDGTTGQMGDVNFNFDPLANGFIDPVELTPEQEKVANISGMGRLRDLREAAALSPDLAAKLEAYTNAKTKDAQLALLPDLLEAWARTDPKFNSDYGKVKFDIATHDPNSGNQASSTGSGVVLDLPNELRERWKDLPLLVAILDSFTNVTTERLAYISNSDAERMINVVETTFAGLFQASYDALVLQTRLKPYVDAISLTIKDDQFSLDFAPVLAKFEEAYAKDAKNAFIDLGEFLAYQQHNHVWVDGIRLFSSYIDLAKQQGLYEQFQAALGQHAFNKMGYLFGTIGDDTLVGSTNNNILEGGAGNDLLKGGAGDDTYIFNQGDGHDTVQDSQGNNTLIFKDLNFTDAKFMQSGGGLVIYGANGDSVTLTNFFVSSTWQAKTYQFKDQTFTREELLNNGLPLVGNETNVSINGWDGANNIIYGGSGNEIITTGAGNDRIYGGAGNDTIDSGAGNDILEGGAGNDLLKGGAGDDTYIFNQGDGHDTVQDSQGNNTLIFKDLNFTDAKFMQSGGGLVIYGANGDSVTLTNFFVSSTWQAKTYQFKDQTFTREELLNNGLPLVGNETNVSINGWDGANNIIYGGSGNEIITTGAGNDRIYGGAGNDTIDSGAGNDILEGGAGNDLLKGGAGDDTYIFNQGDGHDTVQDSQGNNTLIFKDLNFTDAKFMQSGGGLVIYGANGDSVTLTNFFVSSTWQAKTYQFKDQTFTREELLNNGLPLVGNETNVSINGWDGANNIIYGGSGNEIITTGAGNDRIYGGAGNDTIDSGAGNDILEGGAGNDLLKGGAGDDTYIFNQGDGHDTVQDSQGNNTLIFKDLNFTDAKFMQSGGGLVIYGANGDSVTLTNFFVSSTWQAKTYQFKDQTFTREELLNNGLPLVGNETNVSINGWDGANNIIYGGSGNEIITTGAGNDRIYGGAGNDTIDSGAGNDILEGGAGNDLLKGGAGDDTYIFNQGDGHDTVQDSQGNNTLIFKDLNFTDAKFMQSGGGLVIYGANGDSVTLTNFFVSSTWQAKTYQFKDQTFTREELLNNGLPLVGNEKDTNINAASGWDGVSIIQGGSGNETITTGAGNDRIHGGAGNDTIESGAGNDILEGGTGNDMLRGGAGDDTYIFNQGDGHDTVQDSQGNNTLIFKDLKFADAKFVQNGINLIIHGADGDSVTITNFFFNASWQAKTYQFADQTFTREDFWNDGLPLIGNEKDVAINATSGWGGASIIQGGSGNEIITTGAGNDRIHGGAGNDTIESGAGNDILEGGAGNDLLKGGAGDDTYIFNQGDGHDTVQDSQGNNTLIFKDLKFADAKFVQNGINLIIHGADGDSVTITNFFFNASWQAKAYQFADQTFTREDFWNDGLPLIGNEKDVAINATSGWGGASIIQGGSGNETITTGAGNDRIHGGAGNDTIESGAGNDIISGGAGNDILNGGIGNDTYLFGSNHGKDTITDSAGNDTIAFTGDQHAENLWFSRQGNNLLIETLGTTDSITVNSWFSNANYQIETIQLSDGQALINQQVQSLINAMASFAPAAGSSIDVATQKQDYLTQIGVSSYWDK